MTCVDSLMTKFATLFAASTLSLILVGCGAVTASPNPSTTATPIATKASPPAIPANAAIAIFAGGCFWCMEKPFDELDGVISTTSGYTGGRVDNPTYELVGNGSTGHIEAVQIVYDPARVTYAQLLDIYWRQVDPFDGEGQFCDKGNVYVPAIFTANPDEEAAAQASKLAVATRFTGQNIAVRIIAAKTFWPAEDYHQDYYKKNPVRYAYYRNGCGRDARLRAVWGETATKLK
jgi:peptide-methionine (S)-S-oxide reductase